MNFSVLLSIYNKEKVIFFNRAMKSIYDEQTIKPTEIVLVQDGPLYTELYEAINQWKKKLGTILKIISLENNVGLGDALSIGLKACSYELIARMDTDDISLPYRFEKQLKLFEKTNIDICSSWITEFDNNEKEIISTRQVPEYHIDIVKFGKKRCPINHPAAMYKKRAVLQAGSYKKMLWFEDYYLWVRMILSDAVFYNIQEPLVNMRAGHGQLARRKGLKYALSELNLQKAFFTLKFINIFQFIQNVTIRFISRIMPKIFLKQIYKRIRY